MHLARLELIDFRSYARAELALGPGVRVLVGPNAQGKTNLVESVQYLAVGSSHRVSSDAPLVRAGAEAAVIRAEAIVDTRLGSGRRQLVELELRPGGRSRARLNGQPRPRARDVIGTVKAVMFAPEDLALVRGEPTDRRRFLDELLAQRRPAYHGVRADYERILKQRTSLLRSAKLRGARPDATLATWTEQLASSGGLLLAARIAAVNALAGPVDAAYRELVTDAPADTALRTPQLAYRLSTGRLALAEPGAAVPDPGALTAELRDALADVADEEVDRGQTLRGPHRDDLDLVLGTLPAKGYASHGEMWSLALAMRLASGEVLAEVGEDPVVLLDDVFAELDETRRRALATRCTQFEQVIVTAAVDADVPLDGPRHRVHAGTVTTEPVARGAIEEVSGNRE